MDEGSYSSLEEKRVALENKLDRSVMTRIVFSTEDRQFLVQVLREITFSIEVTTVMSLYCSIGSGEIQHVFPVRYDIEK